MAHANDFFIRKLEQADRIARGDDPNFDLDHKKALPFSELERQKADENWRAYQRARDSGHLDYVHLARKCDAYYAGDQWERQIADELNAQRRPHITINMVLSTVNNIMGEHIKTRQEINYRPRGRGATDEVARALNSVTKQIQYNNKSQWNEQTVVMDGIIEDRGYFDIRMNYNDNIFGEIREVARDPRDVLIDSEAKEYDPATWNEVMTTRWLTPDDIEALHGKKKADLLRTREITARFSHDSIVWDMPTRTFGDDTTFISEGRGDHNKIRRVRIIERQHKVLTRAAFFVDPIVGDMRRIPHNWDDDRMAQFAVDNELEIIEKPEKRIRWTVSADDVLLFDDWSLYTKFTIFPFFPYFRRGRPTGLVRHLLSPQDMLNKITSQELHVVNTTANSGWIFEAGSLINMDADELQKVGARTGLVLEHKAGSSPPEKIQPNQVPNGLSAIGTKAQIFFRTVSGLPEGALGFASREVSGVKTAEDKSAASQSLEIVFDNLAKTRQYRAEFMLELLQNFYTEERLVQVTELDIDGNEVETEITINEPTIEGALLNDLTLGEYGVAVSSVPHHESLQDSVFAQALQLREVGVAIPDFVLIENSRIPNRKEVSDLVKSLQGMAEPTPEEIEMNMIRQELDLAGQQAAVAELQAKAAEREANTQLLLAKASTEQQAPLLEMQKTGAELRGQLETMQMKLQEKREELATRVAISREKNETARFESQNEAMSKRLQTQSNRTTKLTELATNSARDERNRPPTGE